MEDVEMGYNSWILRKINSNFEKLFFNCFKKFCGGCAKIKSQKFYLIFYKLNLNT
jgi:hypothetical protein